MEPENQGDMFGAAIERQLSETLSTLTVPHSSHLWEPAVLSIETSNQIGRPSAELELSDQNYILQPISDSGYYMASGTYPMRPPNERSQPPSIPGYATFKAKRPKSLAWFGPWDDLLAYPDRDHLLHHQRGVHKKIGTAKTAFFRPDGPATSVDVIRWDSQAVEPSNGKAAAEA